MAEYGINKGIGRSAEFQGLKSQYLFLFAGGLLGLFVLVVVLSMVGIDSWFCLLFGAASASLFIWLRIFPLGSAADSAARRKTSRCTED